MPAFGYSASDLANLDNICPETHCTIGGVEWAATLIFQADYNGLENEDWWKRKSAEEKEFCLADARKKATEYAQKLLRAISEKDVHNLKIWLHRGNKASRRIFKQMTGHDMGSTEESGRRAIVAYVGQEAWNSYHAAKEAEHKARQEEYRRKAEEAERNAVLGAGVRWVPEEGGVVQTITVRQLIDTLIDSGYRELTEKKRGKCTVYNLSNGKRFYTFRKKIEGQYIQERLAAIGS